MNQFRCVFGYNAYMVWKDKLMRVGVIGTVIAALCCFTPLLATLFGLVGLSGIMGYLDYVLIPALILFICLTIYAVWRNSGEL